MYNLLIIIFYELQYFVNKVVSKPSTSQRYCGFNISLELRFSHVHINRYKRGVIWNCRRNSKPVLNCRDAVDVSHLSTITGGHYDGDIQRNVWLRRLYTSLFALDIRLTIYGPPTQCLWTPRRDAVLGDLSRAPLGCHARGSGSVRYARALFMSPFRSILNGFVFDERGSPV